MSATLWDSFDHLLPAAEDSFLHFNFEQALQQWQKYYQITARTEYEKIIGEIKSLWDEERYREMASLPRLFGAFLELRDQLIRKEITHYTFNLYRRLLVHIYNEKLRDQGQEEVSVEAGVFEYLSGDYNSAAPKLEAVLDKKTDSVPARIFLGYTYLALKDQKSAVKMLTQNLFLAADQLNEEDLYLSQFKMLAGRLKSDYGNWKVASWLLAFESWYRNYLLIEEDHRYLRLIQQKESGERIMQVKYTSAERYRHFVRCLYISEYARHFLRTKKGLITEQEHYMEKLDKSLFERYRKKRKPIN